MATAPKNQTVDNDSPFGVADVVPTFSRPGRKPNPETIQIADLTLESEKDGKARFIKGVTAKVDAENWKRKILAADKYLNKNRAANEQIRIRTSYDEANGVLYFASESLLQKLQANS